MRIPSSGVSLNQTNNMSNLTVVTVDEELKLYPVGDILTTEFKAIQVLEYVEEELKVIDFLKSLLLMELFSNE